MVLGHGWLAGTNETASMIWLHYDVFGVVTLSQIERKLPTTASVSARDFNDLACCSIVKISLISPNVTTPREGIEYRR
jgi:hypothetical protein